VSEAARGIRHLYQDGEPCYFDSVLGGFFSSARPADLMGINMRSEALSPGLVLFLIMNQSFEIEDFEMAYPGEGFRPIAQGISAWDLRQQILFRFAW
jgi:hypothetical protein